MLLATLPASAQWNNDSTVFRVTDLQSSRPENVKTLQLAGGKTLVTWNQQTGSDYSSPRNLFMQLLDKDGVRQLGNNGRQVNKYDLYSFSSPYNIVADSVGNAVIAYLDGRTDTSKSGSFCRPYFYKIDPTGQQLWGPEGVAADVADSLQCGNLDLVNCNGNIYALFTRPRTSTSAFDDVSVVEKLSANGTDAFSEPVVIDGSGTNIFPTSDGFIAIYLSNDRPYAQRYNGTTGQPVWEAPLALNPSCSMYAAWNGKTFLGYPDGNDGVIIQYEPSDENYNTLNVFQRINGNGTADTPVDYLNGYASDASTKLLFDPENKAIYAMYNERSSDWTSNSLKLQKYGYDLKAQWKAPKTLGKTSIAPTAYALLKATDGGVVVAYGLQPTYDTTFVCLAHYSAEGDSLWTSTAHGSSSIAYVNAESDANGIYTFFTEAPTSSSVGVAGLMVNNNGTVGLPYDLNINVAEAGSLASLVPADKKYSATSLKLSGNLNGDDVIALRDMCGVSSTQQETDGKVTRLNLADARFVTGGSSYASVPDEYGWEDIALYTNDDEVPAYLFSTGKQGCAMTTVILPRTTKSIGASALASDASLTQITIPDSVTTIDDYAFAGSGLTSVVVPESVTYMGKYAFWGCANMTAAVLPESTKRLPEGIFSQTALEQFHIPDSVTSIGTAAFHFCYSLRRLTGGSHVNTLGSFALNYCKQLEELNLSDSLEYIGGKALCNLVNLKELKIPAKVNQIVNSSFYEGPFEGDVALERIIVDPDNKSYKDADGVLFSKDGSELVAMPMKKSLTEGAYAVPDGVEKISACAFYAKTDMNSLTLPQTLVSIDNSVFDNCLNLTRIESLNPVPPTFSGFSNFTNVDKDSCQLIVPDGALEAYQTADVWKEFLHATTTGIQRHLTSTDCHATGVYTLDGRASSFNGKGVRIIRYSDGSAHKVVLK